MLIVSLLSGFIAMLVLLTLTVDCQGDGHIVDECVTTDCHTRQMLTHEVKILKNLANFVGMCYANTNSRLVG